MKHRWSLLLCVCLLWTTGCPLPPVPGQPPGPAPAPVAKVDSLWLVTIDDWTQRAKDAATRDLLGNGDYWAKLKTRGHHYNQVDAADSAPYQKQITEAGGLPCVIVAVAATKKELAAVKLPADTAGMDALVKQWSDK